MTRQAPRRPTVRDIARAAKVSVATVSRTFAKPEDVTAATRGRVLAVAEELGYRLNQLAVDFRRGRTNTIVVLVSDITNSFYSEFFKGIEEEARSHGYITLMGDSREDDDSENRYVAVLTSGRADGLILNTAHFPSSLVHHPSASVLSCNLVANMDVPTVTIDYRTGGALLADHLLDLGHKHFAVVGGKIELVGISERQRVFQQALHNVGLDIDGRLVLQGRLGLEYGIEAADEILAMTPRPTAVFAHNDETALGLIYALSKHGIMVPRDISVVGFDDLSFSQVMSPALTTVRLPRRHWGRAACAALVEILETGAMTATVPPIVPTLIVRDSTSRPQSRAQHPSGPAQLEASDAPA